MMNIVFYTAPKDEKAQDQSPDDHSADGADMIAAERYALMTWWHGAKYEKPVAKKDRNTDHAFEKTMARIACQQRHRMRYPF